MRKWGEDLRIRRCDDEKMLRWEDATMWRWQAKRRKDMNMKTGENVSQTPTLGRTLRSDALGQQDSLHLATLIKDQSPKLSQCTIATLMQAKKTRLRHSEALRIMDDKNLCNNTSLLTSNVFAMFVLTCHQWATLSVSLTLPASSKIAPRNLRLAGCNWYIS